MLLQSHSCEIEVFRRLSSGHDWFHQHYYQLIQIKWTKKLKNDRKCENHDRKMLGQQWRFNQNVVFQMRAIIEWNWIRIILSRELNILLEPHDLNEFCFRQQKMLEIVCDHVSFKSYFLFVQLDLGRRNVNLEIQTNRKMRFHVET